MKIKNYRWEMVFWLFVIQFLSFGDRINFSVSAPLIMKELSIDVALMGIIMSGFNIGYTILNFTGGYLAQKYSARKFMAVIIILWSIMTVLTGFGWSFLSLLLIRIIFGMCEGPLVLINTKLINRWMLPEERATSLGIVGASIPLGAVIGIPVASILVAAYGWRSVFYIFGAAGFAVAAVILLRLRNSPEAHPSISKNERDRIQSGIEESDGAAALTASGSTFVEFLKNPLVWLICLVYFSILMFAWGNISWLPTYFVKARGLSTVQSGYHAAIPFLGAALGSVFLGWLSDRSIFFKTRSGLVGFNLFLSVPLIIYAVTTPSIVLCVASFTMAAFLTMGSMQIMFSLIMAVFDRADVSIVSGFMLGFGSFSGILAPAYMGFVLKATNSFEFAYFTFGAVSFIGGFLSLLLVRRERGVKRLRALLATS